MHHAQRHFTPLLFALISTPITTPIVTPARAQCPPAALVSTIATEPTSDVPGVSGLKFTPSNLPDGCFRRFAVSASGGRWVLRAQVGPTGDDAIIVGLGASTAGASMLARVGQASFLDAARTYESFGLSCAIADANVVAFPMNLSGATTDDDFVARHDSQGFRAYGREGSQAPVVPLGVNYGSTFDAVHLTEDTSVRFRHAGLGGSPGDQAIYTLPIPSTGLLLARTDVTAPAGQFASPPQTIDALLTDRATSSATGSDLLYVADLNGPTATDLVLILNGAVIAQEGFVLPGSGFTSTVSAFAAHAGAGDLSPANGLVIFLGRNADGRDWAASPGVLRASTGAPIFAGASELFSDARVSTTFIAGAINSAGEFLVAGYTDAPVDRDAVVVLNNQTVLLREGDPVDVNADGQASDGVFISSFADGGVQIADDRRVYALVGLRTTSGQPAGSAVVAITPQGCNDIDFNNDGVFPDNGDIADFTQAQAGNPCPTCDSIDFNNDCIFPDNADLIQFVVVYGGGPC
jgi:hypothetical protein